MCKNSNEKIAKTINNTIDMILTLFFALLLLFGIYVMYDTIYVYQGNANNKAIIFKPNATNTTNLQDLSENVIAWITIDNTPIDYPIMQGKTNEEYLNKNPFDEYSLAGSIFLDSDNKRNLSDAYNIIYGHHMENKHMFGCLDNFLDETYFNEHRDGTITLTNNKKYKLKTFAIEEVEAYNAQIFSTKENDNRLDFIKEKAKIFCTDIDPTEKIVALTTCKTTSGTGRIALLCWLIPEND